MSHREREASLRDALIEVMRDVPSSKANVDEHHRLQQLHKRVIALVGAPYPGGMVRSDYWTNLAASLAEFGAPWIREEEA